jgi:hypothetical protein
VKIWWKFDNDCQFLYKIRFVSRYVVCMGSTLLDRLLKSFLEADNRYLSEGFNLFALVYRIQGWK